MIYLSQFVAALRKRVSAGLLIAILPLLSSACSQIREDVGQALVVDAAKMAAADSYHDVLRAFGPPHRLSVSKTGMVFLYEEIDLLEQQLGVNLKVKNVALFKAVVASGAAERRLLLVLFDHHGIVQTYEYREGSEAEARGGALQFLFTVAGVVDDDDLSQPPRVHDWGLELLQADLPAALNRQQQLHTGAGGVEQQGTPTAVGQHSLELRSR